MTANDIFSITVDLISERLDSGVIDSTNTTNYQKRTPGLLTMLQTELCKNAPIYKTQDIEESTETSGYVKVTFDDNDFYELYQLLDTNLDPQTDFKIIGNDLYVPFNFEGTAVYRYLPEAITDMTDTLDFDNYVCSVVLPNGLANQLLLNENANLANYFGQRYEELKRTIVKKQSLGRMKIVDVYDSKLNY
jgi:hypothetical protein